VPNGREEQNMRILLALILVSVSAAVGCARKKESPQADRERVEPAGKSTANLIVDGLTGKSAVEAGLKAKKELREIDAKRRKDIEEFVE
jgi:hypothetical protein